MAAVCLLQLMPLHMHLHHVEDPDATGLFHVVDIQAANSADDEQHHDDAHVIDLNADAIVKLINLDLLVPLLFVFLLTGYFTSSVQWWSQCLDSDNRTTRQLFLICSPLRAPPRS